MVIHWFATPKSLLTQSWDLEFDKEEPFKFKIEIFIINDSVPKIFRLMTRVFPEIFPNLYYFS